MKTSELWCGSWHDNSAVLQPGKSLYTTVRELVENALDSCEGIGEPPNVAINMYVSFLCGRLQAAPSLGVASC